MLPKIKLACLIAAICSCFVMCKTRSSQAAGFKILVVMSYEAENPWCLQIKEGIDSVLARTNELQYFYMETKRNLLGGVQKAQEALEL